METAIDMANSTMLAFDVNDDSKNLSYGQYVGLVFSSMSGCLLSIIGSSIILYFARSKIRVNLYHRILAILSIFDILNSLSWMLHPLLFNAKGTPGLYWANGNLETCAVGGFLGVAFALPMWFYSFYLGMYFLLVIRYHWSDRKIARCFERIWFGFAAGIAWAGAIWGLVTKSFNPRPNDLLCFSQGYPYECELDPNVECIRGGEDTNMGSLIAMVSLFCGFGGLVTTTMVYISVRQTTKQHQSRHRYSSIIGMEKRLRTVATQCMLYFLVYANVIIWPVGTNIIYGITRKENGEEPARNDFAPYTYSLISWFFFPITGLFNCMVYLRPRYVQWRLVCPQNGRIWAIRKAISPDRLPLPETTENRPRMSKKKVPSAVFSADTGDLRGLGKVIELYASQDFDMKLEGDDSDDRVVERNKKDVQLSSEDDDEDEVIIFGDNDDGDQLFQLEVASIMEGSSTTVVKTEAEQTLDSIVE
mmetsp:Transcript_14664/g.35367  ORF Transcript_14664/g.35367 Transcript_14664/m.35367 type:complete len:475 (+) Transcript_14664:1608-3032(+)